MAGMAGKAAAQTDGDERDKLRRAVEFISNTLAQCRSEILVVWDLRTRPEAVVSDSWWLERKSVMLHSLFKARARCPGISVYLKPAIKNAVRFETQVAVLIERLVGDWTQSFHPGPVAKREAKLFQALKDEIEEIERVVNPALRALAARDHAAMSASAKGQRSTGKKRAESAGWITAPAAVREYDVRKSSLHDWTRAWGNSDRRKNHRGHIELRVEPLVELLRKRGVIRTST